MTENNKECLCGKKKGILNSINWTRHITSCKVMKNKNKCSDISSFFKVSDTATSTKNNEFDVNSKTKRQRLGNFLIII